MTQPTLPQDIQLPKIQAPIVTAAYSTAAQQFRQKQIEQSAMQQYETQETKIFNTVSNSNNGHSQFYGDVSQTYQHLQLVIELCIANAETSLNYQKQLGELKLRTVQQSAIDWIVYNGLQASPQDMITISILVQEVFKNKTMNSLKTQFSQLIEEAKGCFRKFFSNSQ